MLKKNSAVAVVAVAVVAVAIAATR